MRTYPAIGLSLGVLLCACEITTVESPPQAAPAPEPAPAPAPEPAPTPEPDPSTPGPTGSPEISASGIDACCMAIDARLPEQKGIAKQKMEGASRVCPGISEKVKSGETTKADATKALRVQTGEILLPSACE